MKKWTGVGIGVAVIVVAIIFGIASLPDEVLIESPSVDTSQNSPGEEKTTVSSESISSNEQTEPVEQTEPEEEETQGKVIEVKINDGVGSKDR